MLKSSEMGKFVGNIVKFGKVVGCVCVGGVRLCSGEMWGNVGG